jgi:Ti-type conjugative transfer relaxase TraA
MAIAFARIHYLSRAKGYSAVAAIAYRSGEKLYDERRGKVENYLNHKDHVVHSEIMLPDGANEKFKDRELLWNAVEAAEDEFNKHHKRAQVAVDCILALPKDEVLTQDDLVEMTRRFAQEHFVSKGIPVDFNIHNKGDGNPHAHILRATRRLIGDSFDRLKARDLDPEVRGGQVQIERLEWEKWRNFQNDYFHAKGLDLKVDPNGILSQVHLGKHTFHHPHRENTNHWQENEARKNEALEITLDSPAAILNQITLNRAIFTRADLAKLIDRQLTKSGVTEQSVFQHTLAKVEASKHLINLGPGSDGKEYFTTRAMFDTENDIQNFADVLKKQHCHQVSDRLISKSLSKSTLSPEQANAVRHVVSARGISALLGRAGTGKSYTLGVARNIWAQAGLRVSGIALSGKAADNLQTSSGIASRTIESFRYALASGRLKLTQKDVIVMDEAGMADSTQFRDVLYAIAHAGAKFVYAGDPDQTLPVGPGAPLRALLERTGYAELSSIRRQKVSWMREATLAFADGNIENALSCYHRRSVMSLAPIEPKDEELKMGYVVFYEKEGRYFAAFRAGDRVVREPITAPNVIARLGAIDIKDKPKSITFSLRLARACRYLEHMDGCENFIHFNQDSESTMQQLILNWRDAYENKGGEMCAIMAYTNSEVSTLNIKAREALIEHQLIREGVRVNLACGERRLAIGERIQFLRNNRTLGVVNGQFATIKKLVRDKAGNVLGVRVLTDGSADTIMIDLNQYNTLDYGYAATVNKFQGQTVDESFTYVSGFGWNRYLAYTAMGRHRESARLYVNQENYVDMAALTKGFSREAPKDSLYDWPWYFRERRGMSVNDSVVSRFRSHLAEKLKSQISFLRDEVEERLLPNQYWARKKREAEAKDVRTDLESVINKKKQEHQDAVTVCEYIEAAKEAGLVWAKVFDANDKNQARFGDDYQLSDHTQYREALNLAARRDEIAFKIAENKSLYEKACQHYQLDLEKLEKQARTHLGRENVRKYLDVDGGIHRSRLAFEIMQDVKSHSTSINYYQDELSEVLSISKPNIKTIWQKLRDESRAHEKELLLQSLTNEEKKCFEIVEIYFNKYQCAQDLWQKFFLYAKTHNQVDESLLEAAKEASRARNEQAGFIYKSIDKYRLALNFYHINKSESIGNLYGGALGGKEKGSHAYFSAQRAIKLKKYAYQDYAMIRVDKYLSENDEREKSILADTILRYPKQHDRWISEAVKREFKLIGGDLPKEALEKQKKERYFTIKNAINEDCIFIRREKLVEKLDDEGLKALKIVEEYVRRNKTAKVAWNNYYEGGKAEAKALFANVLTVKRDKLAIKILKDVKCFSPGLALYNIKLCLLEKSLQAQACRDRVKKFLDFTLSHQEKQKIACFMVENRGAHTAALSLEEVDWRTIYPYADSYRQNALRLTLEETRKSEFCILFRYVKLKRRLARVIMNKKAKNVKWTPAQQQHFNRLQARRNALAAQLLRLPYRDIELWDAFRLTPYKCEKHALNHTVFATQLYTYRDERLKLKEQLGALIKKAGSLETLIQQKSHEFSAYQTRAQALSQVSRKLLSQGEKLTPALEQAQLTQSDLINDRDFLTKLKQAFLVKFDTSLETTSSHQNENAIQLPKPIMLEKGKRKWDLQTIKSRLNERAYDVAMAAVNPTEVLNTKKSNANKLIWGQKSGSLQVTISGPKIGCWNDFSCTQSGGRDLLSFIQMQQNYSIKEAINWAVQFLGMSEQDMTLVTTQNVLSVEKQEALSSEQFTEKQWKRILEAQEIWKTSKPLEGTLAESYLKTHRSIDGELSAQYRFHPSVINYDNFKRYPALVVSATNDKKEVQAIQAIYLDTKTANKINRPLRQKQNLGPTKGACVWLNGYKAGQPIAVVEGPETAATILQAKGESWAVVCTLGSSNFKSLSIPKDARHLIMVQDNDIDNDKPEQSAQDAALFYAKRGVTTWRVKPKESGCDFNDLHQKGGINAVCEELKKGQLCHKGLDPDKELRLLQSQIFDSSSQFTSQNEWLSEARLLNRIGQTEMALDILEHQDKIISTDRVDAALARCIQDYLKSSHSPSLGSTMIALNSPEIDALNKGTRLLLKRQNKINNCRQIKLGNNFKEFGVGDVICFTSNFEEKRIKKHQRAKIIDLKPGKVTVGFDNRRQVTFKLSDFNEFDYAYALGPDQCSETPLKKCFIYLSSNLQQEAMQALLECSENTNIYYSSTCYNEIAAFKSRVCDRTKPNPENSEQDQEYNEYQEYQEYKEATNKKHRNDDLPKPQDDFNDG